MNLGDEKWKTLIGGYQIPYDASIVLLKLEEATKDKEILDILDILWENLYHQGDIGTASYYSVPEIVRIAIENKHFNWSIVGLPLTIEHQRHNKRNPDLPSEIEERYLEAIKHLGEYSKNHLDHDLDEMTYAVAVSAVITATGRWRLGKAILELGDNDILSEFLEQF